MINTTPDVHPMHIHLVKFEVVEKGYIDNSVPGSYVRADGVSMPIITGAAVFHPNSAPPGSPTGSTGNSVYTVATNEQNVWKDMVMVPPAGTPFGPFTDVVNPGYVKVRAKFSKIGTYMWHCHILSHEENDMMRPFMVMPSGQGN